MLALALVPVDKTHRSFASFRMTWIHFVVILSAAKDLCATSMDYIIPIPQLGINQIHSLCSCSSSVGRSSRMISQMSSWFTPS